MTALNTKKSRTKDSPTNNCSILQSGAQYGTGRIDCWALPKRIVGSYSTAPDTGVREGANSSDLSPTTKDIIQELLSKGVPEEMIRIPGHGKQSIVHISDNFDEPRL